MPYIHTLPPAHAAIVRRAMRILENVARETPGDYALSSPDHARALFVTRLANLPREEFHVAYLDTQHRLLAIECEFVGTLTQTAVYPRELIKRALQHNAGAVVLAHNHPSGVPEPSHADIALTRALRTAFETVDVRVLDHVIVGRGTRTTSFAERGLL